LNASPQRDDDDTPWGEAFKRHGSQLALGLVWASGMAWLDLRFLWWLGPIVFSLILSPIVSVLSSRATLGIKSKAAKLFLIPEEYDPPRELVATEEYLKLNRERMLKNGFMHAVINPTFNALATGMATSRHLLRQSVENGRQQLLEKALQSGPKNLGKADRLVLLSDPVIMARLHSAVWTQPDLQQWKAYYAELPRNAEAFPETQTLEVKPA